jgi:hypothetical protein
LRGVIDLWIYLRPPSDLVLSQFYAKHEELAVELEN